MDDLTVRENIVLAMQASKGWFKFLSLPEQYEQAEKYIKLLNMATPSADQPVKNLRGGNQQKVVIGKWLTADTDIMIFDEPTRGIDVGAKHEIYKIMTDLVKRGISIIMISSEMPELLAMCDRFIVLASGRIKGEFKAGETTHENIIQLATRSA